MQLYFAVNPSIIFLYVQTLFYGDCCYTNIQTVLTIRHHIDEITTFGHRNVRSLGYGRTFARDDTRTKTVSQIADRFYTKYEYRQCSFLPHHEDTLNPHPNANPRILLINPPASKRSDAPCRRHRVQASLICRVDNFRTHHRDKHRN